MSDVRFTRRGTWWVEASDGRTVQRVGRDLLRFVDAEGEFDIPAEIGGDDGLGVFPSLIRDASGAPAQPLVWQRARELLDVSGDAYDPFPEDAVTVAEHHRWDDLNEHEGLLALRSTDRGLLPAPLTHARVIAPGATFWASVAPGSLVLVRLELELTSAPSGPAAPQCQQDGAETRVTGRMVTPTRLRTATGFILPVDAAAHELPLDEPLSLTGELTLQRLRLVPH